MIFTKGEGIFIMRRFNVTVNGVSYDVVVEEVGAGESTPVQTPVEKKAVTAPAPAAAPVAKTSSGAQGRIAVKAPMPGTILKVNASVGASVKKGDVLCVLEAMKMENDICAPEDGTVASLNVQKGASVNSEDVLVTLN